MYAGSAFRILFAGLAFILVVSTGSHAHRPSRAAAAAPVPSAASVAKFSTAEAFLKAHCLECHGATKQKGDLAFHNYHDEAAVLKDRKVWEDILEKVQSGEMPPKKKARPEKNEETAFIQTIEGIFARHDAATPRDPGHVTIRRLNRAEYNNTIRDLVGVDVNPAQDFPSDEVGQGFDNIGDVLSISPVLMEGYLSAADTIMARAIPLTPPPPIQHRVSGRFLEPAIRESALPKGQRRPLTLRKTLFTSYHVSEGGEYTIGFDVFPEVPPKRSKPKADGLDADDKGPMEFARVALLVDKKELKTEKITGGNSKVPQFVNATVMLSPGDHRMELSLVHTPEESSSWTLRVNAFNLKGPPDTRTQSQKTLLACDQSLAKDEKTRLVLQRFATRAYRRPTTKEEVDHLVKLSNDTEKDAGKWEAGIAMAMQAVLVSPKFLFRVELDDRPDTTGPHAIDEYQLASRLSYFLWNSMPDDELFNLAAKKQLSANLDAQVRRMLADPRSETLVDNFAMQWLQLRRLKSFSPDTDLFQSFDDRLRKSMEEETRLFISAVFREDRSILDLIDADFTFLNGPLAQFYKIADTNGNPLYDKPITTKGTPITQKNKEFVRVHLADHTRGGVLTQASVLCVTSNPTRTSPVKRGKFVLEQILGMPPPPPPANVPPLVEVTGSKDALAKMSLRQRMEKHRVDPSCANCHEKMDGLGFALENFDAVGGFRNQEAGNPVDASGAMPDGTVFKGPAELKQALRERKLQFSRCLIKKLLTYATGRGIDYYDQASANKIVAALQKNDYKFSTLVTEIVKSDPFRMRRGKEQSQ